MDKELLRSREAKKVTLFGFFVNTALASFKIFAGLYGRSGAMIADGIHSLSDFFTDIVVLLSFKYTDKPADDCHNYGHDKYETLGTIIVSVFLAVAGFGILRSGVVNLIAIINGSLAPRPGYIALLAAVISIVVKELLYRYNITVGKKINSSAVIANAWHHRSDALTSLGTFIGIGGSIVLGAKWTLLDPLASIFVSIIIFKIAAETFLPAINELLETSLTQKECEQIIATIKNCKDAKGYHKLRTRRIGSKVAIDVHILVDENSTITKAHNTVTEIEEEIKSDFGINSIVNIHIEPFSHSPHSQLWANDLF